MSWVLNDEIFSTGLGTARVGLSTTNARFLTQFNVSESLVAMWQDSGIQGLNDNDNDNDKDTLREVPHLSNEGLALQARV